MSALTGKGLVTAGGFSPDTVGASAIFDGSADYLEQTSTFGVDESSARFILSFWVFRAEFGVAGTSPLLATNEGGNPEVIRFDADDKLRVQLNNNAHVSNMVFRDVGWYHIVVSVEQGGSPDLSVYVNGEAITWGTDGTITSNPSWFDTTYKIRIAADSSTNYAGQYMAQVVGIPQVSIQNSDFTIDQFGQSFAAGTNGTIWAPIADAAMVALVDGASKLNSFCLTDGIAAGTDASGNGNNFTPSGSPTASENTPSKVYPIFSPLIKTGAAHTITNGGRTIQGNNTTPRGNVPLFAIPANSGKWYFEFRQTGTAATAAIVGIYTEITRQDASGQRYYLPGASGGANNSAGFGGGSGATTINFYEDGVASSTRTYTVPTQTTATVYQVAFDSDTREFWFGIDNSYLDSSTGLTGNPSAGTQPTGTLNESPTGFYYPGYGGSTPGEVTFYFPSGDWTYSAPTDFKEWSSENLTAPTYQGADWFNALAYPGNSPSTQSLTGVGFSPDLVWTKNRAAADAHGWFDRIRTATEYLSSNNADAENTDANSLTSFDTDGFSVGTSHFVNGPSENMVAWNWRGDGTSGSTNTDGSITSTVNVAAPGHFSFGTFTGTGSAATVGHGLGAAPEMIIVKNRIDAATNWPVYHYGVAADAETDYLYLSGTAAAADTAVMWNDTAPTSTVFSVGTSNEANGSTDSMAFYAFRSVPGVCKVGSYTGNGSTDGPYVHLGFKPRWIMIRRTDSTGNWNIWDTERNAFNVTNTRLLANATDQDLTSILGDLLADGFKVRNTEVQWNANGGNYIYLAMADVGGNGILPPIPGR